MSQFDVQLVTPLGPVAETKSDSVRAPGAMGQFEVLPGHIPFLTELHTGVLSLGQGKDSQSFAVSNGFLEVEPGSSVKILVQQAVAADTVDVAAVTQELAELEKMIEAWDKDPDGEYQTLRDSAAWAQARISASV